jgi:hypothetical protein
MSSVQRRLNSTDRVRITRNRVTIQLEEPADPTSFPCAAAEVNLAGLELPPDAAVAIEAYYRSSSMRFACGTVSKPHVPDRMQLSDIDRGGAIRFRLLIVDPEGSGRILASAEGLRPATNEDGPDRQPLLPLLERDLGEEIWRVDVDPRTGPVLLVNNKMPGLARDLRTSPMMQGLILPHALRLVLQELSSPGDEEGDDYWGSDWRRFLRVLGTETEPEEPDDGESQQAWVQAAVEAFCDLKSFAERARASTRLVGGDG